MTIIPELFGKRAVSLLRVSTKKQTAFSESGNKDDIPVQREINNEFIENNKMILVKELIEPGISASKIPMAKREKLQEIFQVAENKEFDVLVVFKHDRISRIQEEYPLILSKLNKLNIRIFVALDGTEKKSPSAKHGTAEDGLINSVEGYTAAKESKNIQERVVSSHRVVIRQGRYRGGAVPFGYTTMNLGETNDKGQLIQSIVINEEEAEVVRIIYDMYLNKLMGIRTIAKWLNENGYQKYKSSEWSYQTVRHILHNETYKGYLHFTVKEDGRTFRSNQRKDLIIIDEDTWNKTQETLKKKVKKSKENVKIISNSQYSLVSGYIFCGYCKSRLGVWTNHKSYNTKKGKVKYKVNRYRCNGKSSGKKCDGNTTYGLKKIDSDIEAFAIEMMIRLSKIDIEETFIKIKKMELDKIIKSITAIEKEINKKNKQVTRLKNEIPNSLIGDSVFSPEELKSALLICEQELRNLEKDKKEQERYYIKLKEEFDTSTNLKPNAIQWLERYEKADFGHKKMLLSKIIEKVIVFKDRIIIEPYIKNMI